MARTLHGWIASATRTIASIIYSVAFARPRPRCLVTIGVGSLDPSAFRCRLGGVVSSRVLDESLCHRVCHGQVATGGVLLEPRLEARSHPHPDDPLTQRRRLFFLRHSPRGL